MNKIENYTPQEALDHLEKLVKRTVIHSDELSEFHQIFCDARARDVVPIRGIHEKLMNYREQYELYTPFSDWERKILRDIIEIWG